VIGRKRCQCRAAPFNAFLGNFKPCFMGNDYGRIKICGTFEFLLQPYIIF